MSDGHRDWQDEQELKLVRNDQFVCSLWPAEKENPNGWFDVGVKGTKEECLAYVKEHCDSNCRLVSRDAQTDTAPE